MEEAPHSCQARRHPAGSQALLCQAQPLVQRRRLLGAVGGNRRGDPRPGRLGGGTGGGNPRGGTQCVPLQGLRVEAVRDPG